MPLKAWNNILLSESTHQTKPNTKNMKHHSIPSRVTSIGALFLFFVTIPLCAQGDKKQREKDAFAALKPESIVFKKVDGRNLKLVLFLPEKKPSGKMPIMLYTHGGGWSGGSVQNIVKPAFKGTLNELLDAGVACAAVAYRRTRGEITAVESVTDCKDAARFLVKNADKWNLDSKRLGVWGGSAGGHLCLMTALADNNLFLGSPELKSTTPNFSCIVSYYPLTSFTQMELLKGSKFEKAEIFVPILGGLAKDLPEAAKKLSPVEYIKADMPPVLLIHGEKDNVLPLNQSEHFLKKSKPVTQNVTLLTVKGAGHSLGGKKISPSMEKVNKQAAQFILKHL